MQTRKTGPAPITRHPLFPAIVSLWFAALFGMGSLALRTAHLESLVGALHIDALVPAAAPPLGFTARILVALALAVIGALVGWMAGRRLARIGTANPRRDEAGSPAVDAVPDAAEAWADDEDLARLEAARPPAAATPATGRRRPLAMQEDHTTPTPVRMAKHENPLDPEILDLSALEQMGFDRTPAPPEPAPAPEVTVTEALERAREAPALPIEPQPAPVVEPRAEIPAPPLPAAGAARLLAAPLDTLGLVEMVERLALALARHREALAAALTADAPVIASRPVAEATIVEVVEVAEVAAPSLVPSVPEPVAIDPAEEPPLPIALPAALRPLPIVDAVAEDEAVPGPELASLLPPRAFSRPVAVPAPTEAAMAPRIEQPGPADGAIEPVVIFPGQGQPGAAARRFDAPANAAHAKAATPAARQAAAPADANATEAALKAALATLQRMSGAA